jgi:hypothetical protein
MAYSTNDFILDAFDGDYFTGTVVRYITLWSKNGQIKDLELALEASGELGFSRQPLLSKDGATALLKHYVFMNMIELPETDVLAAMMLGRWDLAVELISELYKEA